MEFRLLGEPQVEVDGNIVDLGTPKQKVVLVALLLAAGQPVPIPALVERVWDDDPPEACRRLLATYTSRLRRNRLLRLEIIHRGDAYVLVSDTRSVDLVGFRSYAAQARTVAGKDKHAALALLQQAVGLWRGPALAGLPGRWAADVATQLEREYRDAQAGLVATLLQLGRYGEAADAATALATSHPLDERFTAQLIQALGRTGRTGEAVDCYRKLRARLADELGLDPCVEVEQSYLQLLQPHRKPPTAVARPSPAQLPADIPHFIGRRDELALLEASVRTSRQGQNDTAVVAVCGTAGVGKTAVAVHWGHRAADRFADGQLYADLRGFDPGEPARPRDVLTHFLRALGLPGSDPPAGVDELAARYRTAAAGRQLLVVLDNAADAEQVRPLLPGSRRCVVVVTSRDSLAGLVAVHGARRLHLDVLTPPEALTLLRAVAGRRVAAEPDAAAALVHQCARLPLALRVAAELITSRPATPLAQLVAEMADPRQRLHLLDGGGDPRAALSEVFSWSMRRLPPHAARTFELLSRASGTEFCRHTAAALADMSLQQAAQTLELLTRAHLIHPIGADRYTTHTLLQAFAASTMEASTEH